MFRPLQLSFYTLSLVAMCALVDTVGQYDPEEIEDTVLSKNYVC